MDGVLTVGHKKRSVECGVDFPCFGEVELIGVWR